MTGRSACEALLGFVAMVLSRRSVLCAYGEGDGEVAGWRLEGSQEARYSTQCA